jgi:hypothetical protein
MAMIAWLVAVALADPGDGELTRQLEAASARGKGVTAVVGAGGTALFGIGAVALNGSGPPAYMLGTASLLSAGIALPVGASGGNQARRLAAATGQPVQGRAVQTIAWAGYGLAVVEGLGLITLGVMDEDVPSPLIASTVAVGSLSSLAMGLDAIGCAAALDAPTAARRASVRPAVAVGPDGATIGVGGTF